MDFDRYGIEEWAASRPQQLADGYASAQADGATIGAWLRQAHNWLTHHIKFGDRKQPKAEESARLTRAEA